MKYLGSKARIGAEIVDVILSRTKKTTGIWVEPFAGGLNLTTHIPDSFNGGKLLRAGQEPPSVTRATPPIR